MPNSSGSSNSTHRAARRPASSGSGSTNLPAPTSGSGQSRIQPMGSPDSKKQQQAKKLMMDARQLAVLQNNLRIVGLFINSRHLEMLSPSANGSLCTNQVCAIDPIMSSRTGISVYQVSKLMYNEDENTYEKLVSVYSALNSFGGLVAMILQSDGNNVKLYLCTNTSGNSKTAGDLLAGNMRGQFPGCEVTELSASERDSLLDSCGSKGTISTSRTIRSLSMIPSRREDERQHDREFSSQGYEKFIDAMKGRRYTLIVLSQCVSSEAMDSCREGLENMYTALSPYAKETVSYGENESDSLNYSISNNVNSSVSNSISRSFGTSHTSSVSSGRSSNKSRSYESFFGTPFTSGTGESSGTSTSDGTNSGSSSSKSTSDSYGSSDSQSTGSSTGTNRSLTLNRDNKAVQNLLEKLEEHIKRINSSQTFGMWNSACYIIADDVATATMGTSTLAAIFAGDSIAAPRAYCNQWDATNPKERGKVLDYLQSLRHPVIELTMLQQITDANGTVTTVPSNPEQITPAMMISGKEIPTLMGLPRKSVSGITVDSMAEFGRNISEVWRKKVKRPITFGNIYHMGQLEKTMTVFDLDAFASHMFICGSSGSGKSNTTYNLLQKLIDHKVPFLVIEPAKGEYKIEFAGLPGVNIFTADESPYRLLQINPFEFNGGIHIREHLDNIIQVVSACWPLYGAMPGLLKKAFEQVYVDHGWDLEHSERIINRGSKFPVFKDLVTVLERIIDESPYSASTKGDYKGALLNRVSSLCNGFEGQIFGRSTGIPDRTLFQDNTIIDLSSIGSDETRSLIMGILIIKLRNYRKVTNKGPNSPLTHVTVLEEAHNILKRCSHETSADSGNVQGAAVGSLCRCIAEMRSAGEGFMIIDQSPGAVDEAAIRNTAIKVAMRLPSRDDCEAIGAALSLDENQTRELSRLDIGVAAVFHAGWTDSVLAKMGTIWDKRYRVSKPPMLDYGTYTRIQGAVVQTMYRSMLEGDLANVYSDIQELIDLLCKGATALKPTLPNAKQQEILDAVQSFLSDNDQILRENARGLIKRAFAHFIIQFIRLDSVIKIFPLKGVRKDLPGLNDDLTKEECKNIVSWEKELRKGISRYLYMPEECEPDKAYRWPADPSKAEYFLKMYELILDAYSRSYRSQTGDCRYQNAVAYLRDLKFFNATKRK